MTSHPPFLFLTQHTEKKNKKKTKKKKQRAQLPVPLTLETLVTSQEGVPPASEEVCVHVCLCVSVCVCVCVCVYTHPPEVLPVGVLGDAIGRVDLAHQGAEAGSFGDVLPAAHADHLQENTHTPPTHTQRLDKRLKRIVCEGVCDVVCEVASETLI